VNDISQHAKFLFSSIVDKIPRQEKAASSNSEDNLTDIAISNTTTGIYIGEKAYLDLDKRLQAYSSPKINKQKHLDKFIIDSVLCIYQGLSQGIDTSYNEATAYSFKK
jgi:hypothetical protein